MNMSPLQRKFVIKQRIYSISVTLSRLILFLGFIGIWEFTADKGIINAFIFSSPVRLYQTFMDLAKDGVIYYIYLPLLRVLSDNQGQKMVRLKVKYPVSEQVCV